MTVIAVIGTGNVGSSFARRAVEAGNTVILANSRGPETLAGLVHELGGLATAATVEEAVRDSEIVLVALPITAYTDLPADAFAGKIVMDTGNYYPAFNGVIPELEDETTTTSELLQAALPQATVVKAFNNLGSADLVTDATPTGTPDRRALAVASDDETARNVVAGLMDQLGFDAVDVGPLSEGWRYQRDLPAYGIRRNADEMTAALNAATRYRDQ